MMLVSLIPALLGASTVRATLALEGWSATSRIANRENAVYIGIGTIVGIILLIIILRALGVF